MPRIFDNLTAETRLLEALREALQGAQRADFCVGYFNLRGWEQLSAAVDGLAGAAHNGEQVYCRLLIGMQGRDEEAVGRLYRAEHVSGQEAAYEMDAKRVMEERARAAAHFRRQLSFGVPTEAAEVGLRELVRQLRERRVVVKVFLRHPLHAKLYLTYHESARTPIVGYVGSSNLTLSGLGGQGELNVEEVDQDTGRKLAAWFEARWTDAWCLDITDDLIAAIEESWAQAELTPYEVYLKIIYHLSEEARLGQTEFRLPRRFEEGGVQLLDYQLAAVKVAARHLDRRGGVLLGDVVGLGKTLMATALASIFQERGGETLIICPKNLVEMWRGYVRRFKLIGEVVSLSKAAKELPSLTRYRLVIVDESHNLRNPKGKTYAAVRDYIKRNESRCILLSATPYNKSFSDLAAQLGLFLDDQDDLGVRPERYIQSVGGERRFQSLHQVQPTTLAAFRASHFAEDWRELMRLYLVRRTRQFILENYAQVDQETGRQYVRRADGESFFFPIRRPRTVRFEVENDDQYHRLYSAEVVELINSLNLPRYGLGQYVDEDRAGRASAGEKQLLDNLSQAGKRLMGFCRTNLFKRLESSGKSFLQSLDRHIVRNHVFLYALDQNLPLPIGTLDAAMLDTQVTDEDEALLGTEALLERGQSYRTRAEALYGQFRRAGGKRFKWIAPHFFTAALRQHLEADSAALSEILLNNLPWQPERDRKLEALHSLIRERRGQKILVFSQFADTVRYLEQELKRRGVQRVAAVTGSDQMPMALAKRFSPISNGAVVSAEEALDVLIATDVLSEGQNLQDAAIVVNYDLPWAIIRLVQRVGRVDRIGQRAEVIECCSFLPAEGVERIIQLRERVKRRLHENQEVIGSDEQFFDSESDQMARMLRELYTEKAGILDDDGDSEVDLTSYAYEIWQAALRDHRSIAERVAGLPNMVYSTRQFRGSAESPQGVIVYLRNEEGYDSLAYFDREGNLVTQSHLRILKLAACTPETLPQARHPQHHELVARAVVAMKTSGGSGVGALGKPREVRSRLYEALKRRLQIVEKTAPLFKAELEATINDVYRHPLTRVATNELRSVMRKVSRDQDKEIAEIAMGLRRNGRLCVAQKRENRDEEELQLLCSLGLFES